MLSVAVKAVTVAGLLAVTFGPPYSYTLLRAVYSQRWANTEAPFVLGCYTAYLLLLAVNGERNDDDGNRGCVCRSIKDKLACMLQPWPTCRC